MTCTSTDPLVATLFAVYARRFGEAVVILGERTDFSGMIGPSNYGHATESAVNLCIRPIEFEARSRYFVQVDVSLDILSSLGFTPLPIQLSNPTALRIALEHTLDEQFRLNEDQIICYDSRIMEQ